MTDRWHCGNIRGPSPENYDIPIVNITKIFDTPGGAGNVTKNLQSLGCSVVRSAAGPPPIKNRLIDNATNRQLARWDEFDETHPLGKDTLQMLINFYGAEDIGGIVISDYNKGSIGCNIIKDLQECWVKYPAIPIFIDTKRDPAIFGLPNATYFPNSHEFTKYFESYRQLNSILATHGSLGATYYKNRVVTSEFFALTKNPVLSVAGAGDTVVAAWVWGEVIKALTIDKCMLISMAAAALAVEKPFTSTVTVDEIKQRLKEFNYEIEL